MARRLTVRKTLDCVDWRPGVERLRMCRRQQWEGMGNGRRNDVNPTTTTQSSEGWAETLATAICSRYLPTYRAKRLYICYVYMVELTVYSKRFHCNNCNKVRWERCEKKGAATQAQQKQLQLLVYFCLINTGIRAPTTERERERPIWAAAALLSRLNMLTEECEIREKEGQQKEEKEFLVFINNLWGYQG